MFRHASPLVAARSGLGPLRRELSTSHPLHAARTYPSSSTSDSTTLSWTRGKTDERNSGPSGSNRNSSPLPWRAKSAARVTNELAQPLLRPAVLAQRITSIANGGHLDDAIKLLQNAPLDAQNVVTWNNLLALVMRAGRYKTGFSLYIDMKRRGFVPNHATYATLLKGYSAITEELWPRYTQQLENVHKLWNNYLAFVEATKDDPSVSSSDRSFYSVPVLHYFTILRKAGLHDRLFEVYNLLEAEGSELLAPQVYGNIFAHLSHRKALPPGIEGDVRHNNAADSRLIWRQMLRTFAKTGYEVDSIVLTQFIFCLSQGRPADQLYGFDVVRDYLGLVPPGESPVKPKVAMHPYTFLAVLELCMASKKYALCIHYHLLMMEREPEIIDAKHSEVALRALASRSAMGTMSETSQALEIIEFLHREAALDKRRAASLWPTPAMYRSALTACWRGNDWETATRIFGLITRIDADGFLDGRTPEQPAATWHGAAMDVTTLSLLVRTALGTGAPATMRQCVRMVDRIRLFYELHPGGPAEGSVKSQTYLNELKLSLPEYNYYRGQYAFRLVTLINEVLKHDRRVKEGAAEAGEDQYAVTKEEEECWLAMRKEVSAYIEARPRWRTFTAVPFVERSPLGSTGSIARTDESVDKVMTNRHIKSAPAA